ncbi:MAG: CPBP family intramembrane metalloprotease [Bacteroidota bacterium]|nr:CPBP family intramembrane metalloprotease [Bacteroidota bacterium]
MKIAKELSQELIRSVLWTTLLTLVFLLNNWSGNSMSDILIALPFFVALYYFFFSIGKDEVTTLMNRWIDSDLKKVLVFPVALMVLYFLYIVLNKQNPFQGSIAFVPFLIIFPVLFFVARRGRDPQIDWIDFTAFVLYLLAANFIKVNPTGNLPFKGDGFDSVYRIMIMLTAAYSFVTIRGIKDVGFFPVLNLKFLWTAIWVWFVYYLFVFIVGYYVDFIKINGHESISKVLLTKIGVTLLITYLHTGIFEELFFRGILQNMLAKRIGQAKSWKIFWQWGLVILTPLAVLVGYTLKGGMQWFPAFMSLSIFAAAYLIEKANKSQAGVYTALAITSVIFGLVHYHSGAIVYISFACLAGWAYGYTYIKTKNVFYSALVHTLVNSSALAFGLEFMK